MAENESRQSAGEHPANLQYTLVEVLPLVIACIARYWLCMCLILVIFIYYCCSVTKSCSTLIPWTAACQASLSFTISGSLLKIFCIFLFYLFIFWFMFVIVVFVKPSKAGFWLWLLYWTDCSFHRGLKLILLLIFFPFVFSKILFPNVSPYTCHTMLQNPVTFPLSKACIVTNLTCIVTNLMIDKDDC